MSSRSDCGQLYAGFLRFAPKTQTWNNAVDAKAKKIRGSYTSFAPPGNPFTSDDKAVAAVAATDPAATASASPLSAAGAYESAAAAVDSSAADGLALDDLLGRAP